MKQEQLKSQEISRICLYYILVITKIHLDINRRNYNGILSILISKKKLQTLQLELESSEINRDLTCCIYQISHLDKKAEILTQW